MLTSQQIVSRYMPDTTAIRFNTVSEEQYIQTVHSFYFELEDGIFTLLSCSKKYS